MTIAFTKARPQQVIVGKVDIDFLHNVEDHNMNVSYVVKLWIEQDEHF